MSLLRVKKITDFQFRSNIQILGEQDKRYLTLSLTILSIFSLLLAYFTTNFMGVASFSYGLMIIGLIFRRKTFLHLRLMTAAMITDVLLVLAIEIKRHAIATAISLSLSPLQQTHIYVSSLAMLLYLPASMAGNKARQLNRNSPNRLRRHRILGIIVFVLRSLSFALMFSMLNRH